MAELALCIVAFWLWAFLINGKKGIALLLFYLVFYGFCWLAYDHTQNTRKEIQQQHEKRTMHVR